MLCVTQMRRALSSDNANKDGKVGGRGCGHRKFENSTWKLGTVIGMAITVLDPWALADCIFSSARANS